MLKLRIADKDNKLGYVIFDDIRQIVKDGILVKVHFENSSTFAYGNRVSVYIPFNIGNADEWGWLDCGVHAEVVDDSVITDAFLEVKDYRSRLGDSEEFVFQIKDNISYDEFKKELAKAVKKLDKYTYIRKKDSTRKSSIRRKSADTEEKCREILNQIYGWIKECYDKYGFDNRVEASGYMGDERFNDDADSMAEQLLDDLSNLPINEPHWKDSYNDMYADIIPDAFDSDSDLIWALHNNKDIVGVLFDAFLYAHTAMCNTNLYGMTVDDVMDEYDPEDILETLEYINQFPLRKMIEEGFLTLNKVHELVSNYNDDISELEKESYKSAESSRRASSRRSFRNRRFLRR